MLSLDGQIRIRSQGRSGDVVITLANGEVSCWWEFGGRDCIAMVHLPDSQHWEKQPPRNQYPRLAFLEALAAEVSAVQCSSATHTISENVLEFHH